MRLLFITLALAAVAALAQSNSLGSREDGSSCPTCNPCPGPDKCKLPDCYCSTTALPPGLSKTQVPQMIVLTFQNAVRQLDMVYYRQLFQNRNNPNGCPSAGTFFVSHNFTDYYSVQELNSLRHEIGVNSITAQPPQSYWATASQKVWKDEMGGEEDILELLANVSSDSVQGERAPYLQMGGEEQMRALRSSKFKYDASRVSIQYTQQNNILWPYTYDYDSIQDCVSQPCPTKNYKGLWQVPLTALKDKTGQFCSTLEACNVTSVQDVFLLLHGALHDRYDGNRAPLILTLSAAWVNDPQKLLGTTVFLDYVRGLTDVYVVPVKSMIDWVQSPTPVQSIAGFKPWWCNSTAPPVCPGSEATFCQYDADRRLIPSIVGSVGSNDIHVYAGGQREVKYSTRTCLKQCTKCYPSINDTKGTKC